jgi:hypothetical protein
MLRGFACGSDHMIQPPRPISAAMEIGAPVLERMSERPP